MHFQLFAVHCETISRFRIQLFIRIRHCTTCFGLLAIDHMLLNGGGGVYCYALRCTTICVFIFTVFLNEVNVVPPSVHLYCFYNM
jgi:hypothetical protein